MIDSVASLNAMAKNEAFDTMMRQVITATNEALSVHRSQRREGALKLILDRLAAAHAEVPAEERDDRILADLTASPEAAERLVEAFDSMINAIDAAALPLIAKLHAGYVAEGRPRDRFYRSVGRLFRDASGDEIAAVHRVCGALAPFTGRPGWRPASRVELVAIDGGGEGTFVGGSPPRPDGSEGVTRFTVDDLPPGWETAFALLKDHHIATDNSGGYLGVESGPHVLVFESRHMDGLRRLVRLLGA